MHQNGVFDGESTGEEWLEALIHTSSLTRVFPHDFVYPAAVTRSIRNLVLKGLFGHFEIGVAPILFFSLRDLLSGSKSLGNLGIRSSMWFTTGGLLYYHRGTGGAESTVDSTPSLSPLY